MFAVLRNALKLIRSSPIALNLTSSYHVFSKPCIAPQNQFLAPVACSVLPSCGLKVKGRPRRRCKDCYMVWREQRLFVMCKTHPRHKQMSIVKDPKNTWILTHATQSKVRPW